MKKRLITALLFCQFELIAATLLIKNTAVLDFENKQVIDAHILIEDGKFSKISTSGDIPEHTEVYDAKGQLMLPPMIDMHSHSMGNKGLFGSSDYQYIGIRGTANAMLYAGVHGWLDLFSDEQAILEYRNNNHPKLRNEAHVFAAGPCFTVTNGHCDNMGTPTRIINSPTDAQREVQALAAFKPNVMKVVYDTKMKGPTVSKETLAMFIKTAKTVGIPTVVHVGNWDDVRTAATLGASAVTHIPWTEMPEDIAVLMAQNNTQFIPTVGLIAEIMSLHKKSNQHTIDMSKTLFSMPQLHKLVDKELLNQFPITKDNTIYHNWLTKLDNRQALQHVNNSIKQLHKAGVTILVGSDSANEAMYQGLGFHRELFHLQQMGISSWQLLESATVKSHEFLNVNWAITEGAPANFTLVNRAVMTDISQTANLDAVFLNGRQVELAPLLDYAKPGFWQYSKLFLGFED